MSNRTDAPRLDDDSRRAQIRDQIHAARDAVLQARSRGANQDLRRPPPLIPAGAIAGYEIHREIHRGGQGVVYQGVQKSTGRVVAIKVLREGPFVGEANRLRFEREVSILAELDHRHIIGIIDRGTAAGSHFLVMDYIDGLPLDRYAREHHLDLPARLRLFASVCDAVNAAHLRGVIHRDLKPGNILVDQSGEPRILDFGLAKRTDFDDVQGAMATETGQFLGSLPWASPEQVRGRHGEVDIRSDVYSLGVVLYQLVTNAFPYSTVGDLKQVLANICNAEPVSPRSLCVDVDDDLQTIMLKSLNKDADRRYQSVGEMARDVRHYLNREPIDARRDSGWYVLRKTISRYRLQAGIAAASFAILVAFAAAMSAMYGRTAAAEREQRAQRARAEAAAAAATTQAAIAAAVNEFLNVDLLGAAAPSSEAGRGIDTRMRDVLDAASRSVEGKFRDQPLVEASVRLTLGDTYRRLGEFAAARPHISRALELRRRELGNEDEETLKAMAIAASWYRLSGDNEHAEALYREWYETSARIYGNNHSGTLSAMNNLAVFYNSVGRSLEAEQLYRHVLAELRRTLGEEHPNTLITTVSLAETLCERQEFAESETLIKAALEKQQRILGPDHPDTQQSRASLIRMYNMMGRFTDAEPLCIQLLETRRRTHGPEHPLTLNAMNELGFAYLNQSKPRQAEKLFNEAFEIQRRTLGEQHGDTLASQLNLANVYFVTQRIELAETTLAKIGPELRRARGELHPHALAAQNGLAQVYLATGRPGDAERIYREILATYRRAQPIDELRVASGIMLLAQVLMDEKKFAEAETIIRECLAIRERNLPPGDFHHASGASLLGQAVAGQSRFAEAEPILLLSQQKLVTSDAAPSIKRQSLERLVKLYTDWDAAEPGSGKDRKAAEWRARLAEGAPATNSAASTQPR